MLRQLIALAEDDRRVHMKLLGIRFENFACFEECYVPLGAGVQVLVGQNNAGKTAILRGLTALHGLPVGTNEPLTFNLSGYARGSAEPADFIFHVEFALEDGDFDFFGGEIRQWPTAGNSTKRVIEFSFRYLAAGNMVGLQGAALKFDEGQVPILKRENESGQLIQYQRNRVGAISGRSEIRAAVNRSSGPVVWPVYEATLLLEALSRLKNVRMLDAHRVVRLEANMQAVNELTPNVETLAPFLDTLSGNNRRKFREVEALVIRVFPEIEFVNPEKKQNFVSLALSKLRDEHSVPLSRCGTGVEQVLALATFILTAPAGSMLLLDEPHSYLHPFRGAGDYWNSFWIIPSTNML